MRPRAPGRRPASVREALGTVIRRDTVHALAQEAGFSRVEELDADGGFFRLYRFGV